MSDDRLASIDRKLDRQGEKLDEQRDMIADVSKEIAVVKSNQDRDRDTNSKEHRDMREFVDNGNKEQNRRIKSNSDRLHVFEAALHELSEGFDKMKLFIENTKGRVQGFSFPFKRLWEILLAVIGGGALLKLFEMLSKSVS